MQFNFGVILGDRLSFRVDDADNIPYHHSIDRTVYIYERATVSECHRNWWNGRRTFHTWRVVEIDQMATHFQPTRSSDMSFSGRRSITLFSIFLSLVICIHGSLDGCSLYAGGNFHYTTGAKLTSGLLRYDITTSTYEDPGNVYKDAHISSFFTVGE